MKRHFLVVGLLLLGLTALAFSYARRDPLGDLERFQPRMTRNFASGRGLWIRTYTFPDRSMPLYEYLEAHRGEDWREGMPVAYPNGWTGHFNPVAKTLTVVENIRPSLWEEIKEALGYGSKGCG